MAEERDANVYVVQEVELSSDSDTQELLEDIADLDELNDSLTDVNELENLMNSTLKKSNIVDKTRQDIKAKYQPKHVQRLEVVDDYIRNFLMKNNMTKTLSSFQKEWYQYVHNSKSNGEEVPDAHLENEVLKDQIEELKKQLQNAIVLSEKAKATYDKLLKERDFHKLHHQRVQKDKKKLNENIQRLNALQRQYSKKFQELLQKYDFTMKEKMLIKIQRDRLKVQTAIKKDLLPQVEPKITSTTNKPKFTPFPSEDLVNPFQGKSIQQFNYKQSVLSKTNKGHSMPVSAVVFHPKKPIVGTGSDDMLWKIWTVNQSQLIMTGQGHKDWISAMRFHPKCLHIITASGDSTVKIWDFVNTTCTFTFKDHRQPIFALDVSPTGDYLITGSMDHSSRLLDINIGKCRHTFRGHVDTVNSVSWMPYGSMIATASADKTVSIWDVRSSLCVQTFYGHQGAVNGCKFSPKGDKLISCDSSGMVKSWDMKTGRQSYTYSTEKRAAYCVSVDRSSSIIAVGSDEGLIHLFNDITGEKQHLLRGHQQKSRVQAVEFDMNSKMIVSGGSDCSYRIWQ